MLEEEERNLGDKKEQVVRDMVLIDHQFGEVGVLLLVLLTKGIGQRKSIGR